MANHPSNPSIAEITADAQSFFEQVQQSGMAAAEPKAIVEAGKRLLAYIDAIQPHVNKAASAFGGQDENVRKINDLRNKINRVIATYSA